MKIAWKNTGRGQYKNHNRGGACTTECDYSIGVLLILKFSFY